MSSRVDIVIPCLPGGECFPACTALVFIEEPHVDVQARASADSRSAINAADDMSGSFPISCCQAFHEQFKPKLEEGL